MLNKVMLIGNLGRDPEVKFLENGNAICKFSLATNEVWFDANKQKQEKTEWHNVTVFGKQAESCGQYLSKGRTVYVEGKIQTREYEKDGQKKYFTEINAQRVQFLGGKDAGSGGGSASSESRGGSSSAVDDEDVPF